MSLTLDSEITKIRSLTILSKILIKKRFNQDYACKDAYIDAGIFKDKLNNLTTNWGDEPTPPSYWGIYIPGTYSRELVSGTYSIKICGAGGGSCTRSSGNTYKSINGGSGACVIATFTLTNTTNFTIIIGLRGKASSYISNVPATGGSTYNGESSSFVGGGINIEVGGGHGSAQSLTDLNGGTVISTVGLSEGSYIGYSGNRGSVSTTGYSAIQSSPANSDFPYGLGVASSTERTFNVTNSDGAIEISKLS